MTSNVVRLEKFRVGKSTLEEMHVEVTEGIFPHLTFRVLNAKNDQIISCITINFGRFREIENAKSCLEVRSCDCEGVICKHPTQRLYIEKTQLSSYILTHQEGKHYYMFDCKVNI